MSGKRFYYAHSSVYGWAVYNRQTGDPAYIGCCAYLPPVRQDESGTLCESPVLLPNELSALKLCRLLNREYNKVKEKVQ